jgi:hypothetical protein
MKSLGLLVALFIMLAGVAGLFTPDSLTTIGRHVATPGGLYAIAALRVGMGLVLILVAPISRAPKTLRVLGAIALVGGLTTPLLGVERVRAIVAWETAQGTALIRAGAGLALVFGGFIAFAVAAGRRAV